MSYIDLQEVKIEDASGNLINPAQDETLILLRRLVQIASTLATQDSAQRQRISIDAAPASVTVIQGTASSLNATVTGTVTANPTNGTITSLSQFAGVDIRYQIVDWARTAYNTGIRANLINS
jgi:hypothetical protein